MDPRAFLPQLFKRFGAVLDPTSKGMSASRLASLKSSSASFASRSTIAFWIRCFRSSDFIVICSRRFITSLALSTPCDEDGIVGCVGQEGTICDVRGETRAHILIAVGRGGSTQSGVRPRSPSAWATIYPATGFGATGFGSASPCAQVPRYAPSCICPHRQRLQVVDPASVRPSNDLRNLGVTRPEKTGGRWLAPKSRRTMRGSPTFGR